MVEKVIKKFHEIFGEQPLLARSPGRVNIIGELTDYNEGFVLPAAINKAIYVAVGRRNDGMIHLYSGSYDEKIDISVAGIKPGDGWTNYILGVVDQLQKSGLTTSGFNLVIDGDIPLGAGLSSSAAVECASIFALNELFEFRLDRMEMVKMAQKAEHEYAGVMCGIMDQFASMFGKKDHVIKLDCRTLGYEYVPFRLQGIKVLLLNTNVSHSLASSEYNTRRQECEQGVEWIKRNIPEVTSLRDVTEEMLDKFVLPRDKNIDNRCRYVVQEIRRLLLACEDLKDNRLTDLGKKMFATHDGLSKMYGVSCRELDFLVDFARKQDTVIGARMMGGGFGGCTINLVKEEALDTIIAAASKAYNQSMGRELSAYIAETDNGSEIINKMSH